jgi:phage tail-like protein
MVSAPAPPTATNGATPQQPEPIVDPVAPSRLLQYLPAIYSGDPFIGRFLRIFEDVHTPLRHRASGLPHYFDPTLAPPAMQEALAGWVGAERGGVLGRLRREAWGRLIRESVELHRWRGSKRGLRRALQLATGRTPLITDYGNGTVLGDDAHLGANTALEEGEPFRITVTFECQPEEIDGPLVDAIIRRHRPAHVAHTVAFAPLSDAE